MNTILQKKGKKYAQITSEHYNKEYEQILSIVKICKDFCDLQSNTLSFAAKAHYVLANTTGGRHTADDVKRVAKDFDWEISQEDTNTGISLLQKLDLVDVS